MRTPNGVPSSSKTKQSNAELIGDIRRCGNLIDEHWDAAFSSVAKVDLDGLRAIESYSNALAIYCKLLRQRLEAGQATLTGGE